MVRGSISSAETPSLLLLGADGHAETCHRGGRLGADHIAHANSGQKISYSPHFERQDGGNCKAARCPALADQRAHCVRRAVEDVLPVGRLFRLPAVRVSLYRWSTIHVHLRL